ncbi:MAG: serine protease [Opitutaceae bacterium]|jgi:hypothetical protein
MKKFGEFVEHQDLGIINQIAWPVLQKRANGYRTLGTAVSIGKGLAITAWHYLRELIGENPENCGEPEKVSVEILVAAYEKEKSRVILWGAVKIFALPDIDVAIIYLGGQESYGDDAYKQVFAHLDFAIPQVGTEVAVFGYNRAEIVTTSHEGGVINQSFSLHPTSALGHVIEVYPTRRDSVLLKYPCFLTDAPFGDGMSGGPVFDNKTGRVIGVVCSSFDLSELGQPPISYVSLLWPLLGTSIQVRRIDLPEGSNCLFHELYQKGFLRATGWDPFKAEFGPDGYKFSFERQIPI